MKSPFPGMDPFIEGCGLWEDFHNHFVEAIFGYLADTVPPHYLVRSGERGYVVLANDEKEKQHPFKLDVRVTSSREPLDAGVAVAVAEPNIEQECLSLRAYIEEEFRETFVEIREAGSERLVTCIEVLSPSNKKPSSEGWDLYLRKRQGLLRSRSASLIEVDLLRGGQRMPMADAWPMSPYSLLVARSTRSPECLVWPAYSLRRLPPIPVPLLNPDPDVPLDLQPLIDATYARARYHRSIDYAKPLALPWSADEAAWLARQLKQRENAKP